MYLKFLYILLLIALWACSEPDYQPKPRAYLRITFPEKKYQIYDSVCPFKFEYPNYSVIKPDRDQNSEPCWINIDFPKFKARLHLSYKKINNDGVKKYIEDSRSLVYKHTIKAESINEDLVTDSSRKIYGVIYDIKGNTASAYQFFLTDSMDHFIRGALYFNAVPNSDSLSPVLDFIKKDVRHMMGTMEWKKQ